MTKNIIGFGGTYYTGWQVTEDTWTDGNVRFCKVTYNYCQNLSTDASEACRKWNTTEINMDLRGTKTFSRTEKDIAEGCFRFGRFEGKPYNVADEGYLAWYYKEGACDFEKPLIEERLINAYSWTRMEDGRCLSPEDVEAEKKWNAMFARTKELIYSKAPIEFTAEYNLNDYGELMVRGNVEFCVKFPEWKEMYYNGWPYGLPLDKKGKAKRIKNKVISVKSWNVLSDTCIEAVDWEVKK